MYADELPEIAATAGIHVNVAVYNTLNLGRKHIEQMDKLGLNFGQFIAYLIPGYLAIYPLAEVVPPLASLLGEKGVPQAEAIIPLLVLGVGIGIIINAFSWALLRPLFALSGVRRPEELTYTKLRKDDIEVYNTIIEANFRYHQFYSNMVIAVLLHGPSWFVLPVKDNLLRDTAFVLVVGVLFFAARDSLSRAYIRMLALFTKEGSAMTNGDPKWNKPQPLDPQTPASQFEEPQRPTATQPQQPAQQQPLPEKKEKA